MHLHALVLYNADIRRLWPNYKPSGLGCVFRVQAHGGGVLIPFSGALEQKLADMPADEAQVYCKENDLTRCVPAIFIRSLDCYYRLGNVSSETFILGTGRTSRDREIDTVLHISRVPTCFIWRNRIIAANSKMIDLCVYSALPKIIKTGFAAINLIYFFTAGPDEV